MTACPDIVKKLVERFTHHADTIRDEGYNETLIRIDYINPLFAALGWDIDNTHGYAEQYREVVHEDRVKVAGQTKAPDYSFRVGGQRKFFLEAKKPAVDIRSNWEPAFQLRRYAWSAKLACSLLTDFEELAVYDTRIRPKHLDKPSIGRREFISYTDYESRWDFIEGTFSKAAVLRGDFDKYCDAKKGRGAELFDDAFLAEIEDWRKLLAANLALRNESLDGPRLNFAVQRIIDRILFLRIAEDRGTETIGQLQALLNGDNVYARLCKLFRDADARYNSGIFHFEKEKDRDEAPDTLTPGLEIDDKALKQIIGALYYPKSPYEFTMVSADILGSVYERFLGKVISLTPGHRAKIDEKPEVRKAGGVYYTPTYIVDYIVKNTVGKLLEGKSPDQARKIKVLDPACGSGSFLIGAYQFLLDWYLAQYLSLPPLPEGGGRGVGEKSAHGAGSAGKPNNSSPSTPPVSPLATGKDAVLRPTPTGGYALTIAERKRILLDHIHGVDLDSQAVEVTKLNLLLKCLEGETSQTLGFETKLFKERALPDLGNNILCGNSLIGTDIIGTDAWKDMSEEEQARINPFDYERAFPKVFKGKDGGFDAVIGNPPYVRQEGVAALKQALEDRFRSFHGLADLYVYFVERAFGLARSGGVIGYIVSSKFFRAGYGGPLRSVLSKKSLLQLIDYADLQIFDGATTYPVIFIAENALNASESFVRYVRAKPDDPPDPVRLYARAHDVRLAILDDSPWTLASAHGESILNKIRSNSVELKEYCGPAQLGIKTSLNAAFIIDGAAADRMLKDDPTSCDVIKPYLRGRDVERWHTETNGDFMVCMRESLDLKKYAAIEKHLRTHERELRSRYEVRRGDYEWWVIRQVADVAIFEGPKIVYPDLCTRPQFAFNLDSSYPNNTVFCLRSSSLGLLGFLNSKLGWYWIIQHCPSNRGGAYRLFNQYINAVPVVASVVEDPALVDLVDAMITLKKKIAVDQAPQRREQLQREIDATDRQIDALVYQLYGLTDDEIRIVEEATA